MVATPEDFLMSRTIYEPRHEISLAYSMSVKLLTNHHSEFLSFKGGCTGSSEYTLVKIPHCWKSCVTAHKWALMRENLSSRFLTK